ncbi:FKBP-type peptidyl-prolyl cis-trans isomerase [Massilia sp. PAMC28688]|uniref:FKBP-type peptidyl-prolyl cis-trans isomerase n=1 Tax=Massilia sp. PAMC28688 TaxID=2861283 RepID=UPI001C62C793|nr:FKBP-type peptidyl-prolyl cis-trans isomerase [Massilia sp. PAMC28688]QYF91900.1 FKBP-type peptidyl-prolyl cis-trans isomerase [Massilia sp. PAMC28688]
MKSAIASIVVVLAAAQSLGASAAPGQASVAAGPAKLTELVKLDRSKGSGRLAVTGDTVTIHYSGWLYAPKAKDQRGPQLDTSRQGEPHTFKLGAGAVIKGWDEGVRGMRVGGKRTLLVPASMGFGQAGLGPVPGGANLVFDIELLSVK